MCRGVGNNNRTCVGNVYVVVGFYGVVVVICHAVYAVCQLPSVRLHYKVVQNFNILQL